MAELDLPAAETPSAHAGAECEVNHGNSNGAVHSSHPAGTPEAQPVQPSAEAPPVVAGKQTFKAAVARAEEIGEHTAIWAAVCVAKVREAFEDFWAEAQAIRRKK